ncbi:MAG: response regulator [Bacteroidota bacterium]
MQTSQGYSVFLVDDDRAFLHSLEHFLQQKLKQNVHISSFASGEECLKHLDEKPDIVVLDYSLNGDPYVLNGMEVMQRIRKAGSQARVIMLSAQDKMDLAVNMVRNGAYDYVVKNEYTFLKIHHVLRNAISSIQLARRLRIHRALTRAALSIALLLIAAVIIRHLFLNSP